MQTPQKTSVSFAHFAHFQVEKLKTKQVIENFRSLLITGCDKLACYCLFSHGFFIVGHFSGPTRANRDYKIDRCR